ncbi:acyl-CoA thioesterase II [Zopfochytrium polystomum]|nr:acyl-CoA thioesterase II [Zopfochytrium polystomum]
MATSSPSSTASAPLTKIEEALQLEAIDENLFRCSVNHLWKPLRARGVFGGQIIGLALSAATKTVPETFLVHSLHSYFLLPGNNAIPILFHVSRVRDGKSFATRHVLAKQKGKVIFECSCSFQVFETSILNHQRAMPVVPAPEELLSNEAVLHKWIDNPSTHPRAREYFEMRLQEVKEEMLAKESV